MIPGKLLQITGSREFIGHMLSFSWMQGYKKENDKTKQEQKHLQRSPERSQAKVVALHFLDTGDQDCGHKPGPSSQEVFSVSLRNPQITLQHTLISLCLETLKLDEHKNKFKNEGRTNENLRTEKLARLSLEIPFCTLVWACCKHHRYLQGISSSFSFLL